MEGEEEVDELGFAGAGPARGRWTIRCRAGRVGVLVVENMVAGISR